MTQEIVVGEYKEVQTPAVIEKTTSVVSQGVIPSYDRPVNDAALTGPIPEIKKRYRADGDFFYVDIEYVNERLNNAFGPGRWSFIPTAVRTFELTTSKGDPKVEIFVEGRLFAVGAIDTGIVGVGTGNYFPKSDRATYSNAYASAISEATKNAAKKMGIGLDIKDRDAQKLEQLQDTLDKVVETLAVNGKREKVFNTLENLVPQAVKQEEGDWVFMSWMVDEDQIDKVTKAVMKVAQTK